MDQSHLNRTAKADWGTGSKTLEEIEMNKSAIAYAAATLIASVASISSANAEIVRDHRDGVVRDHRTICVIGDLNCRDHREPIIVVPPRVQPESPITVITDPVRPRPPRVIIDPIPTTGEPDWHDAGDNFGISCRVGRNILRQQGFRHIQAYDCQGRSYGYFATKRNHAVRVKMNLDGDIISINRVRF